MNPQDQESAVAIRQGNEAAFEKLFRKWYSPLCGFARKFISNPEDAEELVQGLFCQLWDRRADFNPSTSLKAYLYTAVRNRCFNYLEHHKVRQKSQEAVAESISNLGRQSNPIQVMEEQETQVRIESAIAELPDRCRQVFELSRYEGLKYSEIAKQLEISPKTVEVQIGKALRHLRKALSDLLPLWVGLLITMKDFLIFLPQP